MKGYRLTFHADDLDAMQFARGRYAWADALWEALSADVLNAEGEVTAIIRESDAWELSEALMADGSWCPCLEPHSSLSEALAKLESEIV